MSVRQAAEMVAAAEGAVTAAQATHQTAQGEADRRQGRLDALQGELSAIAARRQAGDEADSDAARVHLLKLDLEGLAPLVNQAMQAAQVARQAVDEANNRLSIAQGELTRAMVNEQAEALEKRLHEMEALLCKGISQLAQLKGQANPRFIAVPSHVYQISAALAHFAVHGRIPG